jgi:hypothetical protein
MFTDPIVDETRKYRDEYAAQFGFDLDAIFDDLKAREAQSGVQHEERAPKPYYPEHQDAA